MEQRSKRCGFGGTILAVLTVGLLLLVSACRLDSRVGVGGATQFSSDEGLELLLLDSSVPLRVDAVEKLLHRLDQPEDIQARRALDEGVLVVVVLLGVREEPWEVPFHLVWPRPQDSDSVRLSNWSAIFKVDVARAANARTKAIERLRALVEQAIAPGQALEGRISLPAPFG